MAGQTISPRNRKRILHKLTQVGARMEDASVQAITARRLNDRDLAQLIATLQAECVAMSELLNAASELAKEYKR